ncbi:MAG: SprT family zinc-dependent metalloprotease [Candidatus Saccharimonadales bacterium]
MATTKSEYIADIGHVRITKKRGVKRISMRIHSSGEVRVSQPYYLPYSAGVYFVKSHAAWLVKQRNKIAPITITNGMAIGKRLTLQIVDSDTIRTRLKAGTLYVYAPLQDVQNQTDAYVMATKKAMKRALNKQAKEIIPDRVDFLARQFGYSYQSVHCKPLRSRWGSCSNKKELIFNCYILMLPWEIIDYIIMHELSHTKHMNHSTQFWDEVASTTPDYILLRKQLKALQPAVHAFYV